MDQIFTQKKVLIDDKMNFLGYLESLSQIGANLTVNDFFFSDPLERLPGGWIYSRNQSNSNFYQSVILVLLFLGKSSFPMLFFLHFRSIFF